MRMRGREFKLRLTEDEHSHLEKQAKKAGLTRAQFLRNVVMGIQLRARPPDTYYKLLKEINAIGVNINQIAHIANAEQSISKDKIDYLTKLLDEIMNKVCDLR